MTIGISPFFTTNKSILFARIQRAKVLFPNKLKYNLEYSNNFIDIVKKLLNKDPKKRLGATGGVEEVLRHPWFDDVDIRSIEAMTMEAPIKPDIICDSQTILKNQFNQKKEIDLSNFL